MDDDSKLAGKLNSILPYLNERQQRLLVAAEAHSLGYGGVSRVSRISGISRPTMSARLARTGTRTIRPTNDSAERWGS